MTQAFKYALIQVLCIGDKADDADSGSPEADSTDQREWWEVAGYMDGKHAADTTEALKAKLDAVDSAHREPIKAWLKENGYTAGYLPVRHEHVEGYETVLDAAKAATEAARKAADREAKRDVKVRKDGTAPTAGEVHDSMIPAPAPEGHEAPPAAAESPEPALPAPTTPESPPDPTTAAEGEVDAIIATIKAMTPAEVDAGLVRRGVTIKDEWNDAFRRTTLGAKMSHEAAEKRTRAKEEF